MIRLRLRSFSLLLQYLLIALFAFGGLSNYPIFSPTWWIIAALLAALLVLVSFWPIRRDYEKIYLAVQAGVLICLTFIDIEFMFLGIIMGPPVFLLLPLRSAMIVLGIFCLVLEVLVAVRENTLTAVYPGLAQVLATFGFGYVYYLREQAGESRDKTRALLDDLQIAHQKLELYANQVQELTAAEERNRLARDLHDSVKQQAFAASAQLGAAQALWDTNPPAARDHLQKAAALLDEVRRELGMMIYELRPAALQGQGLAGALREWGAGWSQQCGIPLEIHVAGERSLNADTEQALFRITQEALSNIARHSRAQTVKVDLAFGANDLRLSICDDGQGFDPQVPSAGFGLRSMRERAERLPSGSFEIITAPEHGTTLRIHCTL